MKRLCCKVSQFSMCIRRSFHALVLGRVRVQVRNRESEQDRRAHCRFECVFLVLRKFCGELANEIICISFLFRFSTCASTEKLSFIFSYHSIAVIFHFVPFVLPRNPHRVLGSVRYIYTYIYIYSKHWAC